MDIAINLETAVQILLAAAAALSLLFMVKGLVDMQKINAADANVLEVQGVVRKATPRGSGMMAVVTLNVEGEVRYVDCMLPGPLFGRCRYQATDFVRVLWRRGDARAVSVHTIRQGQAMFIIGIMALAVCGLLAFWLL